MGMLIYSAAGTALMRPGHQLDLAKLEPGRLMSSSGPEPTPAQAIANAATPLAERLRQKLLDTMGLRPEDLAKLTTETRDDLEAHLARAIHQKILRAPEAGPGAFVDVRA